MNQDETRDAIYSLYDGLDQEMGTALDALDVAADRLNNLTAKMAGGLMVACDKMEAELTQAEDEAEVVRECNAELGYTVLDLNQLAVDMREGLRDIYEILDPERAEGEEESIDAPTEVLVLFQIIDAAKAKIVEVLALATEPDDEESECDDEGC